MCTLLPGMCIVHCSNVLFSSQNAFGVSQVQLQAATEKSGKPILADLVKEKELAEQGIQQLLQKARTTIQGKLQSNKQQQQQKDISSQRLHAVQQTLASTSASSSSAADLSPLSPTEVRQRNEAQLQASHALSAAFSTTRKAMDQLQQCLAAERALLEKLKGPLLRGLAQSGQLVQQTADAMQTHRGTFDTQK